MRERKDWEGRIRSLVRRLRPGSGDFSRGVENYVDGNFDASHILMTRLWQGNLAHLVERGFAIAIPVRGVLVFCDMDSTDGLAMLKDLINRVGNATNYKLSDAIFQIRKRV